MFCPCQLICKKHNAFYSNYGPYKISINVLSYKWQKFCYENKNSDSIAFSQKTNV